MTPTPPAEPAPIIRIEALRKTYDTGAVTVDALRGIDLALRTGSFWAIMGPSGSGKSTLLNLLGCLDRPSSGRYILEGRDIAGFDDDELSDTRLRRLGFVFQSFNLIPQLTVRENVELPLFYLGLDAAHCARRAEEVLAQVGLADRMRHRPFELSGGQQQRAAIARALCNDPALILADEPTGNLDSANGAQIMELFFSLNRAGRTIVMVTHEPDIAACARSRLHLRDGLIERVEGEA